MNTAQYLNHRLIRWSIVLQQYDYDVEYCAGRDNKVADFFSRNPRGCFEKLEPTEVTINELVREWPNSWNGLVCDNTKMSSDLQIDFKNIEQLQRKDIYFNNIIDKIESLPFKKYYYYT